MAPPAQSSTRRIPAWKRLGLQLKYATDAPTAEEDSTKDIANSSTGDLEQPSTPSRPTEKKRALEAEHDAPPTKKQRVETSAATAEATGNGELKSKDKKKKKKEKIVKGSKDVKKPDSTVQAQDYSENKEEATKELETLQPEPTPKKSVSFSADTKPPDDTPASYEAEPIPDSLSAAQRKAEKRRKREGRTKNRPKLQQSTQQHLPLSSSSSSLPDSLYYLFEYLRVYHHDRSKWKFQKNRETQLFKNLLDLDRLPSSYNIEVGAYLAGLKSEGAKQRIAEASKKAITSDDAELDKEEESDTSPKEAYNDAIASFREHLIDRNASFDSDEGAPQLRGEPPGLNDTWAKRFEKRRRAELVFSLARGKNLAANEKVRDEKPLGEQVKRAKKSKRRSEAVEDDTSSSSSSEESSDDDTSSSGSSSDSTSSESDSDSDSVSTNNGLA
ncbi:hypothetical protein AJ80_04336 [Polytolypa hystricis UAMH7299]|uniref:WKF domain-containing protein n=1 Tax=Polytolypa hystricis (strain UAMH7299) TaxID=1447883 RepID=A0A2B7YBK3_POLH7|nr:hypothetical protein AJ80_04336 [Polytolypa hystricis UAMH7299]